ncbi:MAG TPA: hypothetical protein VKD28_16020 [Gemmatimonadales bacterium]|nr:hypothetical protein [Gemmatimonadales bacterium]
MKTALAVIAVLAVQLSSTPLVRSQTVNRVLIAELHFGPDSAKTSRLELEKETIYWAEVVGRGTPLLTPVRGGREAFIVPVEDGKEPPRFQIYPYASGPHVVSLVDRDSAGVATVRLYRDVAETERVQKQQDRGVMVGLMFAGGAHSGLGLDSVAGPDPRGGSNYEACILMQSSDRFATCVGGARQYMPDYDEAVGWLFLEERARLFTATPVGTHNTDVGVAVRLSKSLGVGSRGIYPAMLSFGVHLTQHLAGGGRRRGWSIVAGWQHGSLKGTHTSQDPVADQLVAGLIWIP